MCVYDGHAGSICTYLYIIGLWWVIFEAIWIYWSVTTKLILEFRRVAYYASFNSRMLWFIIVFPNHTWWIVSYCYRKVVPMSPNHPPFAAGKIFFFGSLIIICFPFMGGKSPLNTMQKNKIMKVTSLDLFNPLHVLQGFAFANYMSMSSIQSEFFPTILFSIVIILVILSSKLIHQICR